MLAASKYIRPVDVELEIKRLEWFTPALFHSNSLPERVSQLKTLHYPKQTDNGQQLYKVHVTNWKTRQDCFAYPFFVNDTDDPAIVELYYQRLTTTVAPCSSMVIHMNPFALRPYKKVYTDVNFSELDAPYGIPSSILGRNGVEVFTDLAEHLPESSLRLRNDADYCIRVSVLDRGTLHHIAPLERPFIRGAQLMQDIEASKAPKASGNTEHPAQSSSARAQDRDSDTSETSAVTAIPARSHADKSATIRWPKPSRCKPKAPPPPTPAIPVPPVIKSRPRAASPRSNTDSPPPLLAAAAERTPSPPLLPPIVVKVPPPAKQPPAKQPPAKSQRTRGSSKARHHHQPRFDRTFPPACYNGRVPNYLPGTLADFLPDEVTQSPDISSTVDIFELE